MTETEALRIGRQAVQDAQAVAGDDRIALTKELCKAASESRELAEAFALTGLLLLQAEQEKKH